MTLSELARKTDECRAAGFDVRAMPSSDLFNPAVPKEVKDVLSFDLTRRWSEKRARELAAV